jgi:hypothetical protein
MSFKFEAVRGCYRSLRDARLTVFGKATSPTGT